MKILDILKEKRKNPRFNPKISINSALQQAYDNAAPLRSDEDIINSFVSFTELPKLGINPQSTYNTPIGIYSYPVQYVIAFIGDSTNMTRLPFAGDSPWANIFSIKPNRTIVNLSSMTESEYVRYCDRLMEIMPSLLGRYRSLHKELGLLVEKYMEEAERNAYKKQLPGGKFWYVTLRLAKYLSDEKQISRSVAWNYIFRKLNISGCVDKGSAIIHSNEPNQAVFFSLDAIDQVDLVANKYSKDTVVSNRLRGKAVKDSFELEMKKIKELIRSGNLEKLAKYIEQEVLWIINKLPRKILSMIIPFFGEFAIRRIVTERRLDKPLLLEFLKFNPFIFKYFPSLLQKFFGPLEYAKIVYDYAKLNNKTVNYTELEKILDIYDINNPEFFKYLIYANPAIWMKIYRRYGTNVDLSVYRYAYQFDELAKIALPV